MVRDLGRKRPHAPYEKTAYVVPDRENPKRQIFDVVTDCKKKAKRAGSRVPTITPVEGENFGERDQSILAIDPVASDLPKRSLDLDPQGDLAENPLPKVTSLSVTDIASKGTLARSGGILTSFTTVGKSVLNDLKIAAEKLSGPAYIILEFINREWKGAAIGIANAAAAIAAGFAASGPVGWAIDIAINVLFLSMSSSPYNNNQTSSANIDSHI